MCTVAAARISVILSVLFSGSVFAQSVTPTGPFTAEGWASLYHFAGITITCDITLSGEVASDATFEIDGASFSDGGAQYGFLCPFVGHDAPWGGQVDSVNAITIEDMTLTQPFLPDCAGDVTAGWTNGDPNFTGDPALITFDNTMLGNCVIVEGELEVTHDATGVGLEFTL